MNHFVIPLDFSAASQNALHYAWQMALQMHVRHVSLFHAFHMPMGDWITSYEQLDQTAGAVKEAKIKRMKEFVHDTLGHLSNSKFIHLEYIANEGEVAEQLAQITNNNQLIVMGTQGQPHTNTQTGGSYTSEVMLKLTAPVLAIPAGINYTPPRKIVYAIDYEKYDHQVLLSLKAFADTFDSTITLLHINPTHGYFDEQQMANYRKTIHEIVQYENMNLDFVNGEDVEAAMHRYVDEKMPDLMVMLSRKGSIKYNKYANSFSRQMIMHTHIPLLIFHQQAG
ncbi:universal stress protein [Sphingobacteriales bacterium UPWRP_1]|nr:hypothetical protein BVG80_12615 [Sphingobacteriales bacterium TSM_CSM]PSJ77870.1 universal stress protein [Sphingobacteriales bacterium UPWRP_1]